MTAPDDAVKAVTALQFNAPWDPWGLTPDEARTVIAAAMPHIRAQIADDIEAAASSAAQDVVQPYGDYDLGLHYAYRRSATIARGDS